MALEYKARLEILIPSGEQQRWLACCWYAFTCSQYTYKVNVESQYSEADEDNDTSNMHTSDAVNVRVGSHSVPIHVDMATELQAMQV